MTYASIEEVWGGVSGSNQLKTPLGPLESRMHPIHLKRMEEENKKKQAMANQVPKWKTNKDLYQCNYGTHNCVDVYNNNYKFNQEKKQVAQGTQPFPPGSPHPQNYTFLPQYPWYPWARDGYLGYGPSVSSMWYNNPWMYRPDVAYQIQQQQMMYPQPMVPINIPYQPNNFYPQVGNVFPPMPPPIPLSMSQQRSMQPKLNYMSKKKKESFTNELNDPKGVKNALIYFIFFLIAIAVVLCIFMLAMSSINKK